jgi:hypothetical protein
LYGMWFTNKKIIPLYLIDYNYGYSNKYASFERY